jgi:hypothetical protein
LTEETEIPKVPHHDNVDKFFRLSRRSKQRIPTGGKTVNAEFYKGVIDRPLNRAQRVRPAGFRSRDFVSLHHNAPALKAASFCQFLTPINVTTLYRPVFRRWYCYLMFGLLTTGVISKLCCVLTNIIWRFFKLNIIQ